MASTSNRPNKHQLAPNVEFRYKPKRQRTGALQKLRHFRGVTEVPPGFGVRQSSGALA